MKKKMALFLALVLSLTLAACGEQPSPAAGREPPTVSEPDVSAPEDSDAPESSDAPDSSTPEESPVPESSVRPDMPEGDRMVMYGAYADMLETRLQTNTLPDGRELPGDMSGSPWRIALAQFCRMPAWAVSFSSWTISS